MSAEIINLSKARKAKAKADKSAKTAQNRFKFGRGKAEKALEKAQQDQVVRRLDQAKRDPPPQDSKE
jgi:hypothetical protein